MPEVSRQMIRASLLWLLIGSLTGVLLLINKAVPFWPAVWVMLPIHVGTMIFGWMLQFILGVAYWMLPKYRDKPHRGPVSVVRIVLYCFNGGLLFTIAGHVLVFVSVYSGFLPTFLLITGYLMVIVGTAVMACVIYPRIRTYRGGY